MAEWIGMLGGLLMVLLVLLFGLMLLKDLRLIRTERHVLLADSARVGGWICFGLLLMLMGSLCGRLSGRGSALLFPWLQWRSSACSLQYPSLSDGAGLWDLCRIGMLPGATLLYRGMGGLLLGVVDQASIFIGLICGGLSLWCGARLWHGAGAAACLPGAVLLFLPSSFAPMMTLALFCLLLHRRGSGRLALIAAAGCCLMHPFGIGVLAAVLLTRINKVPGWAGLLLWWMLSLTAGILLAWQGWSLQLLTMSCAAAMLWITEKQQLSGAWLAIPAIASGMLTLCLL